MRVSEGGVRSQAKVSEEEVVVVMMPWSPSVSCHNLRGGFGLTEGDELPPQYWSSSIASTCVFADDALPSEQPAAYASDMAEQSQRELS